MEGIILIASTIVLINGLLLLVSADIMVFNNETPHQIEVEFRDMPSLFGGVIPPEGIQAMVIYADPPDACSGLKPPPNITNVTGKWALLIKRYGCSFENKVRNAQNASYHIAIVHNVDSTDLEPMSAADGHGIYIPSIFVGNRTGELIRANYQWFNGYFVTIDDTSPDDINKHLLVPFAIVVGICFFIMLGFMVGVVIKCIQDRRRAHRHRLPTSTLKKIPTAKFQKGDPYDTCAICIEDYVEGDKLRILPCSHAYHSKCIDPWLTRNRRVCPICKRKVFAAGEKPPTGGSSDSDSDMDIVDDRTPLVLPSGNNTQGGTFDNMSENPLVRQGRPLWHRSSYTSASSSSTSDGSSSPSDGSSMNSHSADVISNSSGQGVNEAAEVEHSVNPLIIPGTSIVPINGDIHHPPTQQPEEWRSKWYYFWN